MKSPKSVLPEIKNPGPKPPVTGLPKNQPSVNEMTKYLLQMLKNGKKVNGQMKPLSLNEKNRVTGLIKFLNDPNAKAGAISKVIASIGSAGGALAVNIGEVISGTVIPKEETKRRQIDAYREVALAQNEANKSIQEQAIAAGIWNAGLMGNPDNTKTQQSGSSGTKGNVTPGSFFGG